jgi:hypothetical protein
VVNTSSPPTFFLYVELGCGQKSFMQVYLLSQFLVKGHLPKVSSLSANYKDDEMIPGGVCR